MGQEVKTPADRVILKVITLTIDRFSSRLCFHDYKLIFPSRRASSSLTFPHDGSCSIDFLISLLNIFLLYVFFYLTTNNFDER